MPWNLGLVWDILRCRPPFSVTNPEDLSGWRHAIWDGSRYVVLGSGWLGVSSDYGQNWNFEAITSITSPQCVASNGSRIVTCGTGSLEEVFTSDNNGASWTSRATLSGFSFPDVFNIGEVMSITSNGSGFVLCGGALTGSGNNIYYSTNGSSWSGVHAGPISTQVDFSAVRHLNGAYYIAGTDSGTLLLEKSDTGGSTWTTLTPPAVTVVQFPFLWALNGQLIMKTREVDDLEPMRLWTSSDEGASWTEITTGLYDIVLLDWTGTEWFAVTDLGVVMTGTSLGSLSIYPTMADALILAASDTNFIIEGINSPTGTIEVIDPDCDDGDYGIPFIFYNVQEMETADNLLDNDGTAGNLFDTVRPTSPLRWVFENVNHGTGLNTGGPYPQYQEDFGGFSWLSNEPLSVVFAFDMPEDPSRQIYTYTEHYIYGENWDGFLMYAELSVEADWIYFTLNLWDSVFPFRVLYESSLYFESDWFVSLIVPGRNVIGMTVWPASGTNYAIFNGTHSDSFPSDPPPSPYTYFFSQIIQDPGLAERITTGGLPLPGIAEYPAPYSESNIDIEDFDYPDRIKVQGLKAVAFTRKAVTEADIAFWRTVDLSTLPTF